MAVYRVGKREVAWEICMTPWPLVLDKLTKMHFNLYVETSSGSFVANLKDAGHLETTT